MAVINRFLGKPFLIRIGILMLVLSSFSILSFQCGDGGLDNNDNEGDSGHQCFKDDEQVHKSAIYCVGIFQEKFKLAKQHVLST